MLPLFNEGDQFRKTEACVFILQKRRDVCAVLEEVLYCDILYRRLVLQMIFDLIIGNRSSSLKVHLGLIIHSEIKNFLRVYPSAKMPDLSTEELIETAEELFSLFYRNYRHEIRDNFQRSPRIDHVEITSMGIYFKMTKFSG